MIEKKILEDVINPNVDGLLKTINIYFPLTFADTYRLELMDNEYIDTWSGLKLVSHTVDKNMDDNDEYINTSKLAQQIGNRFARKWNKIWEGLIQEYVILDNYNMTEEEITDSNVEITGNRNNKETINKTLTDSGTDNLAITENVKDDSKETYNIENSQSGTNQTEEQVGSTSINENKLYGLGSTEGKPSSSSTGTDNETTNTTITLGTKDQKTGDTTTNKTVGTTGSENRTKDLTQTDTGTVENTENTKQNTIDKIKRTLKRKGNIGVTTSSQMQEQYLKIVDAWYDFCKIVYNDLDSVLVLSII